MYLFLILTITVSLGSFAQTEDPTGGSGCMDPEACNYCAWATEDSGTCDYTCIGCMDEAACNYNPSADISAECLYECIGCMDGDACNYDETVIYESYCVYPEEYYDCFGNCIVDIDCAGECGGAAVIDECGVCNGDGDS